MAYAYKCDRCGNFFARDEVYEKGNRNERCYLSRFMLKDREHYIPGDPYDHTADLCPDCLKELEVWFDNPSRVYSIPPVKKKWWEVIFRKEKKNG